MPEFKKWRLGMRHDGMTRVYEGEGIEETYLFSLPNEQAAKIVHEHNTGPVLLEALRAVLGDVLNDSDMFRLSPQTVATIHSALSIAGEGE